MSDLTPIPKEDARAPGGSTPPGWFEKPANINKIVKGLFIACAILLPIDLLMHKHGYFSFEHWPMFFGIFGFLAYTFIVLTASYLRRWLKRGEDYYDG
ncbi:MAG: hypothetical protein V3W41_00410 [Planctomycetota bacterium]